MTLNHEVLGSTPSRVIVILLDSTMPSWLNVLQHYAVVQLVERRTEVSHPFGSGGCGFKSHRRCSEEDPQEFAGLFLWVAIAIIFNTLTLGAG